MPVFQRARMFSRKQKKAVKLEHHQASWRRNTKRRRLQQEYTDQKQWQNWLPNKTRKGLRTAPQLYYLSIHNHQHIPKIGMKAFIDLFICFRNDGAIYHKNSAIWRPINQFPEYYWILDVLVHPIRWYHMTGHKREGYFRFDSNYQELGTLVLNWMQYTLKLLPSKYIRQCEISKWKLEISMMSLSIRRPKIIKFEGLRWTLWYCSYSKCWNFKDLYGTVTQSRFIKWKKRN